MVNFDFWGNINPQLLRELKSRLNWRNGLLTAALSVVSQILLVLSYYSQLPKVSTQNIYQNTQFCLKTIQYNECATDTLGQVLINWPKWWGSVAVALSWLMAYALVIGGVYFLASSFSQEEKRGTLDFIRLTPQKASTIFGGKFLGVPVLVYLGVALALPLQFHAARQAGIARFYVLSWDVLLVMLALLLCAGGVLAALWFKTPAILLAIAAGFLATQLIGSSLHWYDSNNYYYGGKSIPMEWYGLEIGNNLLYYFLFIGLVGAGLYWLYRSLERRYLKPKSTVLSKSQSYLWSLMFHLFMVGLFVYHYQKGGLSTLSFHPPFGFGSSNYQYSSFINAVLGCFGLAWLVLLVPLLLPSRQALVEWSRYRHLQGKTKGLWRGLLWDDKSPAILAVALNVAIAMVVWLVPMSFYISTSYYWPKALLGGVITVVLAALYSAIAHWVTFWQVNNRHWWTTGIIGGLVFLPLLGATIISFGLSTERNPLLLVSPFLWVSIRSVSGGTISLLAALQIGLLSWVVLRFSRTLGRVGRSESRQQLG